MENIKDQSISILGNEVSAAIDDGTKAKIDKLSEDKDEKRREEEQKTKR